MNDFQASFTLTPEKARLIAESLKPELKDSDYERSKTTVRSKGDKLILNIKSPDLHALRAAVNTNLRWIIMAAELSD
jgi:tRNA threonylcarbamoyladenosine modification (KEOPS) complex  Pcc1 subunit